MNALQIHAQLIRIENQLRFLRESIYESAGEPNTWTALIDKMLKDLNPHYTPE